MNTPILFIFSGLPGAGKTTLAQGLARETGAVYLRIDTIEQALRDLCQFKVEGEGYRLSYRVAKDNLLQGNSVIADCCNPIALTREEWQQVVLSVGARYINIEVYCSDESEHRFRVEHRMNTVANLVLPTWEAVQQRHYEPWDANSVASGDVVRIDTQGEAIEVSVQTLLALLRGEKRYGQGSHKR